MSVTVVKSSCLLYENVLFMTLLNNEVRKLMYLVVVWQKLKIASCEHKYFWITYILRTSWCRIFVLIIFYWIWTKSIKIYCCKMFVSVQCCWISSLTATQDECKTKLLNNSGVFGIPVQSGLRSGISRTRLVVRTPIYSKKESRHSLDLIMWWTLKGS